MDYQGRYQIFDTSKIRDYPLSQRKNKTQLEQLTTPATLPERDFSLESETLHNISQVAKAIVQAHQAHKPVVVFTGAHLIKNGLSPVLIDLVNRGLLSLIAGNGAVAIHDFELALIGATSEDVPKALGKGQFGMAREFAYINQAMRLGHQQKLGLGESLGRMICDNQFRDHVLANLATDTDPRDFGHADVSLLAQCYRKNIPFTVHVGIGTDVTDQHHSFDAAAKGGCSGRDFLIFTQQISRFTSGGVFLNIGSAVTGPEVLLKAISMAANVGCPAKGLITADFDLKPFTPHQMTDESSPDYYNRDQKSVVTRIPQAFDGHGYYIQGNHTQTIPALYCKILEELR